MQDNYNYFSGIYDELMESVPYDEWAGFIHNIIVKNNRKALHILDAGCGTGNIIYMLKNNYNFEGFDISEKMLNVCKSKNPEVSVWIDDIAQFNTQRTYDVILCIFDTVNYLDSYTGFASFINRCYQNLNKNGIVIFDIITKEKITSLFKNNIFTLENRNIYCIWYNKFLTDSIFVNTLDFFVHEKNGLYRKVKEIHKRRLFDKQILIETALESGFKKVETYDGFTQKKDKKKSERIVFVLKKGA
ncbi:MAG: class I SAM-dependent methyltransferase [Candidatus Muiribacteriota bacterium]|jgi:SAM-dependent methyltransferase